MELEESLGCLAAKISRDESIRARIPQAGRADFQRMVIETERLDGGLRKCFGELAQLDVAVHGTLAAAHGIRTTCAVVAAEVTQADRDVEPGIRWGVPGWMWLLSLLWELLRRPFS